MSRAHPLPPQERRQSIVAAVIPLLMGKGAAVTTREMAEAAGVAEGTIFSVFEDKTELIRTAIATAVDPRRVVEALGEIHHGTTLEAQLTEAARILTERLDVFYAMAPLLRSSVNPKSRGSARTKMMEANATIRAALTDLFERHADHLRVTPTKAAAAFSSAVSSGRFVWLPAEERMAVDEVVDTFLFGVTKRVMAGRA